MSDLGPLSGLSSLSSLDCSSTQVTDLGPLSGLRSLAKLDCYDTMVSDLGPLSGLSSLSSLDCSKTRVTDLGPLSGLSSLSSLDCSSTQVTDLGPLSGLTSLSSLDCGGNAVTDLGPLSGLTSLSSLECDFSDVTDLGPLSGLVSLSSLDCGFCDVTDLGPLSGLSSLSSLDCSDTQVSNLGPLSGLTSLSSLDCHGTKVSDLGPLSGLTSLSSLDCSGTKVTDLDPLSGLTSLLSLKCSEMTITNPPETLVKLPALRILIARDLQIAGIPAEILSTDTWSDNCLERMRSHLKDLRAGVESLPDVKLFVLGNGRIGKTQICRRLRGENYEAEADSTHGILVTSARLPLPRRSRAVDGQEDEALLHLWDFGGQDLYHGTHALFMKTRSIILLVWTPKSEGESDHVHRGMTFRNHPLAYWVDYVRHLGGVDGPVLIVQNQCERGEDEASRPPVEDRILEEFHHVEPSLHYSARDDRHRAALNGSLSEAVLWLRGRTGQATIGKGRLTVKRAIETMRDADATRPTESRQHRTLSRAAFDRLCDETGGVSNPAHLLDYLHHAGIVFHHDGLFGDQIILDQSWALEAVYTVFNREKSYQPLRSVKGRFNRELLESLVWGHYSVGEQQLFLSLMESCGVCFEHRPSDPALGIEAEYIAPDLLPDRKTVELDIERTLGDEAIGAEIVADLPFLHPGVMRGIIARIGKEAGVSAEYWKGGICFYEATTRSRALIEERRLESRTTWGGQIVVTTRGGLADELIGRLREWVEEEIERSGCRGWTITNLSGSSPAKQVSPRRVERPISLVATPEPPLIFIPPPSTKTTYCVSYAWEDESKLKVDQLCADAKVRGIEILRDTTGMGIGDSITRFMERLGAGDRVFVFLSEKYLKSPFCMFELYEVWLNSRMKDEEFHRRVRVFRLPDAAISTPLDRVNCAIYWKKEFEALDTVVREHGGTIFGEDDFRRYRLMQGFSYHIGDILARIADRLHPKDFDQFLKYGFDDPPSSAV